MFHIALISSYDVQSGKGIPNSGREMPTTKFHVRSLIDCNVLKVLLQEDVRMMLLVGSQSAFVKLDLKVWPTVSMRKLRSMHKNYCNYWTLL